MPWRRVRWPFPIIITTFMVHIHNDPSMAWLLIFENSWILLGHLYLKKSKLSIRPTIETNKKIVWNFAICEILNSKKKCIKIGCLFSMYAHTSNYYFNYLIIFIINLWVVTKATVRVKAIVMHLVTIILKMSSYHHILRY